MRWICSVMLKCEFLLLAIFQANRALTSRPSGQGDTIARQPIPLRIPHRQLIAVIHNVSACSVLYLLLLHCHSGGPIKMCETPKTFGL